MNIKKLFINLFSVSCVLCLLINTGIQPAYANITLKLKETRKEINRLKQKEVIEKNKLYSNQLKKEKAENDLKYSKAKYETTKNKLGEIEEELRQLTGSYNVQEFKVKNRIRQIYRKQNHGIFELILTAENINDLLDRIYYQNCVTKKDKEQLEFVKGKIKRVAYLRNQVESNRRALSDSIANINQQQRNLELAIKKNESQINKLQTDRKAYERAEKELAIQSKNISTMISRNTKNSSVSISSGFMRPLTTFRVTSNYGYRIHPIFKSRTFHSGIDLGAAAGTPIYAANSGKVIYSGWYGGYGKVVIIDHGKINNQSTSTLYAHMSSIGTSLGEYVVKGQKIGNVGSTGYSTGPHLHFEVRKNGQTQNPLNYI